MSGGRFDDGKDEGALRTIGEVSKALDIKAHVLRYWEQQFPQLEPLKRSGGRRYYRPEDVVLIEAIDRLVNREGYTLKGAQQALDEGKVSPQGIPSEGAVRSANVATQDLDTAKAVPAEIIARLRSIRADLADALDA
jgi:DNA-binding transcriptional MerR regulator